MKKYIKILGVLAVLAIIISGCGQKNQEGGKAKDGTNKPFVYVAQQVVGSIDPAKVIDETELIAAINLYDPLYYPNVKEKSMDPIPHLAEKTDISNDGLVYTMTLKKGVTFHSGNPFTADDVVYSMTRMLEMGVGNSWLWNNVLTPDNVKKIDDQTVEFTLNNPYAPFIASMTQLFIVDSKLLSENEVSGDFGQKYLEEKDGGSGPYSLAKWDRESQLDFKAYEDYWQGWHDGQVKDVQMKIITEEATVKTLLVSGQADMVHQWLTPAAFNEFSKNKELVVESAPSAKLQHISMNTQKAPTDDLNVRQAIAQVFDYNAATEDILNGSQKAEGSVPIVVTGHEKNVTTFDQDVEKAKEVLSKSKYKGDQLKIDFMFIGDNPESRQYGQLLQDSLKKIGIEVNLLASTWPQMTEAAISKETTPNTMMISDTLKYPHVDSHTYGIYHPSAQGSFRSTSWYENDQANQLLDRARESIDEQEQLGLYQEAQTLITAAVPSIYVANPTHNIAYRNNVKGYSYVGLMGYDVSFYSFSK